MRSQSLSLSLAAAAAGALALAAPAAAAPVPSEQVNRASGVAGAFGLAQVPYTTTVPYGITDDGRHAFFSVSAPQFVDAATWAKDAVPGAGLWVRDVQRNVTTRISTDGFAQVTGIDRTSHVVSFTTTERLSPQDRNDASDLYAYEPLTGLKLLVSRGPGLLGQATGLTGPGTITRGSTVAVFQTAQGIVRRELLTGRNAKIGDGRLFALPPGAMPSLVLVTPDNYVSNDGRVVSTDRGVITPSGLKSLPKDENFGSPQLPFVGESGRKLYFQTDTVRVQDVATGVVTKVDLPEPLRTGTPVLLQRPTADEKGVLVSHLVAEPSSPDGVMQTTKRWDLASGAVTDRGSLLFLSRNERFGLAGDHLSVTAGAAIGSTLPGGVDLPPATAYLDFNDRCEFDFETEGQKRVTSVSTWAQRILPKGAEARVRASATAGGPIVVDKTVPVPPNDEDRFDPQYQVELPFTDGAFHATLTVKLVDGRTITDRVVHTPRPAPEGC